MCGRYTQTKAKQVLEQHFDTAVQEVLPRFNVAPTQAALVLHSETRRMTEMRWGFVPSWSGRSGAVGEPIALCQEPELQFAHGFVFLEYPYQPSKHGVEQRLSISFETSTGMQDRHVYSLRHGFRFLKRIEPK